MELFPFKTVKIKKQSLLLEGISFKTGKTAHVGLALFQTRLTDEWLVPGVFKGPLKCCPVRAQKVIRHHGP